VGNCRLLAAVLAAVGYLVHRWSLVSFVLITGSVGILIDVTTRNLQGAGHDDRLLVAAGEALLLVWGALFLGLGTMAGKRRVRG
jgi:hypothetical protein